MDKLKKETQQAKMQKTTENGYVRCACGEMLSKKVHESPSQLEIHENITK